MLPAAQTWVSPALRQHRTVQRAWSLSDAYNKSTDETGQGLLIMKDTAAEYTTAESFAGKKVAAQSGSLQYNLVTDQLPKDVVIEQIGSLNDGILMLTTGKVDAIAVSGDNGKLFAQNYDNIQMSDFFFDYSSDGNVVMMKKGEKKLAEEINKIIAELNETDLYQQWTDEATEPGKIPGSRRRIGPAESKKEELHKWIFCTILYGW